mmetsp:Transcript_31436/g.60608  ORF Transcript_31436/g.60608 Transcript_31436/m.60608 type:complete len:321 (-) Transcript_31436:844-1806(-)
MRRGKAVVEGRPEASEHGGGVGGGGGQRLARLRGRRDVALAVPHHIGLANLARVAPRPPSGGLLPVVELLLGRRVGVGVGVGLRVGVEVLRRVHPLGLAQHAIPAGCLRRVRERRVQTALLLLLLLLMVLLSVLLRMLLLVVGSAWAPWLRGRVLCAVAASRTRGALLARSHRVVPHGASTMRRSPNEVGGVGVSEAASAKLVGVRGDQAVPTHVVGGRQGGARVEGHLTLQLQLALSQPSPPHHARQSGVREVQRPTGASGQGGRIVESVAWRTLLGRKSGMPLSRVQLPRAGGVTSRISARDLARPIARPSAARSPVH